MRSIVVISYSKTAIESLQQRLKLWVPTFPKGTYSEFHPATSVLRPSYALTFHTHRDNAEATRDRLEMVLHSFPWDKECVIEEFDIED
jgi:hypothetical protein